MVLRQRATVIMSINVYFRKQYKAVNYISGPVLDEWEVRRMLFLVMNNQNPNCFIVLSAGEGLGLTIAWKNYVYTKIARWFITYFWM